MTPPVQCLADPVTTLREVETRQLGSCSASQARLKANESASVEAGWVSCQVSQNWSWLDDQSTSRVNQHTATRAGGRGDGRKDEKNSAWRTEQGKERVGRDGLSRWCCPATAGAQVWWHRGVTVAQMNTAARAQESDTVEGAPSHGPVSSTIATMVTAAREKRENRAPRQLSRIPLCYRLRLERYNLTIFTSTYYKYWKSLAELVNPTG